LIGGKIPLFRLGNEFIPQIMDSARQFYAAIASIPLEKVRFSGITAQIPVTDAPQCRV
jgi:hypothetical protein